MSTGRVYIRPLDIKRGRVDMNHGAGGRASAQLTEELFAPAFDNTWLRAGNDGADLPTPPPGHRLVVSTDAHVVSPLFFPGGDIGSLAVHGTLNDVAMMGAVPRWLSAAFVLEEGLALAELTRIVESMAHAARLADVVIVAGDTKVVQRGKGDGVFLTTTGIGFVPEARRVGGALARPGGAVLISGSIGEHGVAVLSQRESLGFETTIESDSAALHGLTAAMFAAVPESAIDERAIPVLPQVEAACELLGLDPLYVANEGKLVAVVAPEHAQVVMAAMRAHPRGERAARIGTVREDPHCFVRMATAFGGERMVDWLSGERLPRIC